MVERPVAMLPARCRTVPVGVKFHPGHYIRPPGFHWSPERQADDFRFFDSVGGNPHITGFVVHFTWAYFEAAPRDYTRGFRIVDAYLDKVASLPTPKYLILQVADRSYGHPTAHVYPPYVVNNGWVSVKPADQTWPGGLTSMAASGRASVMDRLIALSRAYAARYDTDRRLVMFGAPEASHAQLERWFTESKKVWRRTPLRLFATETLFSDAVSAVVPGGVAIGGPDPELPLPDVTRPIEANRLFRGEGPAARDLRGAVPWVGEVRELGLGGRYVETPEEIFDYFYHQMRCSYMIWLANDDVGGDAQRWPAILAYIDSIRGRIHTDRPTTGTWT